MTQIDFYLLSKDQPHQFVCRLVDKIYRLGHRIFIHVASKEQAIELDESLWSFDPTSFIPHTIIDASEKSDDYPVLIGLEDNPQRAFDVMVNLAPALNTHFSRFQRVAEVIGNDDAERAAARERYRFYKDRGYTIKTHNL